MKAKYWAIIISVIMIASFVASSVFYMKSDLFDSETGNVNKRMVYELQKVSIKISVPFGAHSEFCTYEEWERNMGCDRDLNEFPQEVFEELPQEIPEEILPPIEEEIIPEEFSEEFSIPAEEEIILEEPII